MAENLDDILSGKPEQEPETVSEQEPEQTQPEAEAETPGQPEPAKEPEKAADPDPKHVPLATLLDQRDAAKQAKQEAAFYRQQMEAMRAQQNPPKVPDLLEDSDGFSRHIEERIRSTALNSRLDASEFAARAQHSDDKVDAALAAAEAAGVKGQFLNHKHPWGEMVKWHQQQQVTQEIGSDPAAYKEKLRAEIMAEVKATMAAEQARGMAANAAGSVGVGQRRRGLRDAGWGGPTDLSRLIGE